MFFIAKFEGRLEAQLLYVDARCLRQRYGQLVGQGDLHHRRALLEKELHRLGISLTKVLSYVARDALDYRHITVASLLLENGCGQSQSPIMFSFSPFFSS